MVLLGLGEAGGKEFLGEPWVVVGRELKSSSDGKIIPLAPKAFGELRIIVPRAPSARVYHAAILGAGFFPEGMVVVTVNAR